MTAEIDAHIGRRLRERRWMLGLTQSELGARVGIKFQQIQKYETAQNRVSARRLWALAEALDTPISYFFDGLETAAGQPRAGDAPSGAPRAARGDLLRDREAIELVSAYYALPEDARRHLSEFLRLMRPGGTGRRRTPRERAGPARRDDPKSA